MKIPSYVWDASYWAFVLLLVAIVSNYESNKPHVWHVVVHVGPQALMQYDTTNKPYCGPLPTTLDFWRQQVSNTMSSSYDKN